MQVKEIGWKECKEDWEVLYNNNDSLSPYQSYIFQDKIKSSANIHNIIQLYRCKSKIYKFINERGVVALLPLMINSKNKRIYLFGHFCSVGHCDYTYKNDISCNEFEDIIEWLKKEYSGYIILFDRISCFSKTAFFLDRMGIKPKEMSVCVKINISNYDDWFKSLSKSCRQNIRTSYNRLCREGIEMKFESFINETPNEKIISDNLSLFSKRISQHMKRGLWLSRFVKLYKKREAFGKALFSDSCSIGGNIYLNGQVVAACNGLIANDKRAIITRLSIDTAFGKYSPGGLLINEFMKLLTSEHPEIKSFDLSRGDEPYKYTYGGVNHFNFNWSIEL